MPSFSRNLEETLHRAVAYANQRKHEYATLEHLLLSLTDDEDKSQLYDGDVPDDDDEATPAPAPYEVRLQRETAK